MNNSFGVIFARISKHTDLIVAMAILATVTMLILPLPEWLLDTAIVINIAAAVVVALVSVNVTEPLQFSVFPSLLLITTLFRLALSIAATKLILGTGAAGRVIETFGTFVVGGDFVVGLVAFLILVIVQFVVITGGAGRVAEVAARFTLDAMPGKQMAIDADLNSGLIDEDVARIRRKTVQQEADFYGAMDGASKFVRGDAIAAIIIMLINIVGGFAIGFFKGNGDFLTVMKTYTLLTVGEGLVSQIPALLISTSTGLMVTRASSDSAMGTDLLNQVLAQPKALGAAGGALALIGFVPGFPTFQFLIVGGLLAAISYGLQTGKISAQAIASGKPKDKVLTEAQAAKAAQPKGPEAVMPLLMVDPVEFEFGYGLMPLVDPSEKGDLIDRITAVRRQLAVELGLVMPSVRVRDNMQLNANEYVIRIRGEEVARGDAFPHALLAMDSGSVIQPVPGNPTKEPVFNLDALWINGSHREIALQSGYTVIEPAAMIATHLTEIVRTYAAELLSRQDVQALLDNVKITNSAVVDELIPQILSIGEVQKVLQNLLRERVPIRDMVTILETLADFGSRTKETEQLAELVRASIARTITRQLVDEAGVLHVITFEPLLEQKLQENVQTTAMGNSLAMDPRDAEMLIKSVQGEAERAITAGHTPVLLCSNQLRMPLRRIIERSMPSVAVVSYHEISPKTNVDQIGEVRLAA
jgi:flagellar biosynthesis protein FlhA